MANSLVTRIFSLVGLPSPAQFRQESEEKQKAEQKVIFLTEERERDLREHAAELAVNRSEIAGLVATLEKTQTIIHELDGTILFWNEEAERLYGWSRLEAVGQKVHRLLETELPEPLADIQKTLLEQGSWTGEFRQRCRDASLIWVSSHWTLRRNAAGEPVSVVKVNNDITAARVAQQALRVSEATARSLFENASQGILTADRSGRIVEANIMMETLFGYGRAELIGASVEMLLPEGFRQAHVAHRAAYSAHPHARTMGQDRDLMARRKDGSEFPVEICLSYVTERQSGGLAVAFISDITARKQANRRLVVSNRDLESALARLQEELENKSRFLANMSHELRSPLNSIIGFGEILLDRKAGEINALQEEFLGDCQRSARHLLSLINDIFDLEKVAAGQRDLTLEHFDAHQLVRETVTEVGVTAASRQLELLVEADDRIRLVFLDRRKTKQVLLSLVMNAVKFTPDGGTVIVRTRIAGSKRWVIEIEDTGVGISADDQTRLFREFEQRENSTSKDFKGTGLGLVLVRNLVEAQGGSITVESSVGVGSTFSVTLPLTVERRGSTAQRDSTRTPKQIFSEPEVTLR